MEESPSTLQIIILIIFSIIGLSIIITIFSFIKPRWPTVRTKPGEIWRKNGKRWESGWGGYGSYSRWVDTVRYIDSRYIGETNYGKDEWSQSELLRTKDDAIAWIVAHGGTDEIEKIKWPE